MEGPLEIVQVTRKHILVGQNPIFKNKIEKCIPALDVAFLYKIILCLPLTVDTLTPLLKQNVKIKV